MERYLDNFIKNDSSSKIVLLSGPRQAGKTTLAKNLFSTFDYLNFDLSEDRVRLLNKHWNRESEAIIFDEIHKMKDWKRWIKGIYDTQGNHPRLIVTGSAQFDTFRKVGDSLAGRYFSYRLHPIDIKEGCLFWQDNPNEVLERICNYSGFPEPFLMGTQEFYKRWQISHLDIILRQDFLDLYAIRHIKSLELLVDLLKERVGSPISYSSLSRDIQADYKTIKSWIGMLENIYAVFQVTPYHKNIARSILKEPKIYFYDTGRLKDKGMQLENLVACALLKAAHFLEDTKGYRTSLHYLKTRDGHEIDFCVCIEGKPVLAIEVKNSDNTPSPTFHKFAKALTNVRKVQLVKNLERSFSTPDGIEVLKLADFLKSLDFTTFLKKSV